MRLKLFVSACSVFFLISCNTYNPIGKYINKSGYESTIIEIKEDSTFIAYISGDISSDSVDGKWKRKDRELLLIENTYPAVCIINKCETCKTYKLSIYDSKTKKTFGAYFKIFSKGLLIKEDYSGFQDSVLIIMPEADSLYLTGYPIGYFQHYQPISIRLPEYNAYIEVYLEEKINYFADQMWIVKSNKMKTKCIQNCDTKKNVI